MPFDIPEESIFVLIFLLISFFNWIGEKVKKSKLEGANRRPQTRSYDEEPPDFQSAPTPTPSDSREENPMRQILESLGIPVEEETPVVTEKPPALPTMRQVKPTVEAQLQPEPDGNLVDDSPWARQELTPEEEEAMRQFQGGQSEAHRNRHSGTAKEVRKLLSGGQIRTAFVLKEILDNPKCFDS